MKKRYIIILLSLGVVGLTFYFFSDEYTITESPSAMYEEHNSPNIYTQPPSLPPDTSTAKPLKRSYSNIKLPNAIDTNPLSETVLVNKAYGLSSDFAPNDLVEPNVPIAFTYQHPKRNVRQVTARALEEMFEAASASGIYLSMVSGYRPYNFQRILYNNQVKKVGVEAANMLSAPPGNSEHQTGLAVDISCDELDGELSDSFAQTPQGIWVSENCYKYGFIIRYPKDKVDLTEYAYEPWHIRYVGVELATSLKENNMCLEEYYQINN